ncbi:unnamed protein product [Leptidea sinapis]|uniref:Uncharacterized protein n=1 Tax=Leptidea sinapis TaxID=189913 RepID=A0A5E4PMY8_9NEOP|nr:unnamed protein product [Leptidea sinapis]
MFSHTFESSAVSISLAFYDGVIIRFPDFNIKNEEADEFVYRDVWGGISLMFAANQTSKTLMPNTTFDRLDRFLILKEEDIIRLIIEDSTPFKGLEDEFLLQ